MTKLSLLAEPCPMLSFTTLRCIASGSMSCIEWAAENLSCLSKIGATIFVGQSGHTRAR